MTSPWRLLPGLLLTLTVIPALARQAQDPRTSFIQALGEFSLALEGAYGDEGSSIRSALTAMEQGLSRWDIVIRTYEAAMAAELSGADPLLAARMHTALGGVYLDRRRVNDAMREFVAARELDATRPDVHTLLGLTYSQLVNDAEAATQAFRRASALDPSDPVRAYMLARHLMNVGDSQGSGEALALFRENQRRRPAVRDRTAVPAPFIRLSLAPEATGVEPFFPPALYADGFALLQQGAYEESMTRFRDAASRDPLAADLGAAAEGMRRAAAAFRDGAVSDALQHLKAASDVAADRSEPHRLRGLVYVADRQYENGVEELRTAIRLSPRDERARVALAEALVESEQFPEAEQALRATIEALPESGRARYMLGRLHQRQGKYAEAVREFEAAIRFNPLLGLNGIYQTIGALEAAQQNFERAAAAYSRRIDVHPNDADAHHDLGEIYLRQGRHPDALAELTVAVMLNPALPAAWVAIGQLHLREGQYDEAVEASRRALELDAAHMEARYVLATSLMRQGKTEDGKRELQAFERLQTEDAAARVRQLELGGLRREAAVSASQRDHQTAVALLRKALLIAPESASSHLDLGLALVKAGQAAEAIDRFREAATLNAPFDVHRHLAEAYASLGQTEESRKEQAVYERMKQEALKRRGARASPKPAGESGNR